MLGLLLGTCLFNPGWIAMANAQPDSTAPSPSSPAAHNPVIGVVQSSDNAAQWQAILNRLADANLSYQVIDWQTVDRNTQFAGIQVLFLPDVATISSEHVLALQDWVNRGGRVIVSGATGTNTSSGVRRALQSLFGAYWDATLTQPATLQPVALNSQRWLREGDTTSLVVGGALIPTGLGSQSVATWRSAESASPTSNGSSSSSGSTVAIVITRQTVFLGWRWGDTNSASTAFDTTWFSAVLGRFDDAPPILTATTPASPAPASTPTAAPQPGLPESPSSLPTAPQASSTRPLPPLPTAPRPLSPLPSLPDPPDRASDPPGLVVAPGAIPISLVDEIAMRQELENLIGRFESALLAADAAVISLDPAMPETETEDDAAHSESNGLASSTATSFTSSLTASIDPTLVTVDTHSSDRRSYDILATAQQQLKTFSELVDQRDYAAARETWLSTRQLLWNNFPTDRPLAQTEIRAIWLDRGTIVEAQSRDGLAQIFDRLAAAGINTVFFETVNAGYPIYPSEVAPQQNPLTHGWDPLAAAVELAHERDMELHAWVWTFAAGNEAHNHIVNLPSSYPGPILAEHPDWASYDNRGNLILAGQEEPFLDPANPAVRRYLLQLFEEIVTRYDVDGLQLDYIRYPFQDPYAQRTQGYGTAARQQFQQMTGVDPMSLTPSGSVAVRSSSDRTSGDLWQQWTDFRVNQVSSFVAETSQRLHELNPDLVLSVAVFPMPEAERIRKIQQHWEVWAERGDVDMVVVMTYAADTNRLQQLATPWLTEADRDLGSTLIVPSIRILNLADMAVFDQIQALRDLPSGGYALFATAHLQGNLQTVLSQTQGSRQSDPIPYREPFAAALDRFTALQQEWQLLLNQDQLWLRESERENWQAQAEALRTALIDLESRPSAHHLRQARERLQTFRTSFADWMHLQALTQEYRVQTWNNRLATLERLLDYGERTALEN